MLALILRLSLSIYMIMPFFRLIIFIIALKWNIIIIFICLMVLILQQLRFSRVIV